MRLYSESLETRSGRDVKNPVANLEWWRPPAPPLALLLLALATVFLFGGDRGHFYKPFIDDHITLNHMTVAENLAPEHHFLGFYRQILDADGNLSYLPYNRFPVLGHILIRLVTLPFPDDISARLHAARMLMLAFFTAAATLAYLTLCRLVGNRWTALAATLLAFSSYHSLYYNDLVATEGVVDLFGVLLVFHGMGVSVTEHRHGQLLAKMCVALLLGWHVYAILGPFVLFGLMAAWRRRDGQAARRHVRLGVVAVLFGSVILAANFTREYVALGGEVSLAGLSSAGSWLFHTGSGEHSYQIVGDRPELSSLGSMLYRSSILFDVRKFQWLRVVEQELNDLGLASVPYAISSFIRDDAAGVNVYGVLGIVVILSVLVLMFSPAIGSRLPLVALAVLRPCWLVIMPYNQELGFERSFYVGVPLVLFTLMLAHLDRLCRGRGQVAGLAGVASVPVFVLSSLLMAQINHDPEHEVFEKALTSDVESIRALTERKAIFLPGNQMTTLLDREKFYFTDSIFVSSANRHLADFVVAERLAGARSLTPDNELVFLYERASYNTGMNAALISYKQRVRHDTPIMQSSDYAVYFVKGERNEGKALLYLRNDCPAAVFLKPQPRFFLHVVPVDTTDLPAPRQQYRFDNLDFGHSLYWKVGDECYVVQRLPAYRIAEIRTGQFIRHRRPYRFERVWEDSFSPIEAADGVHRSS